MTDYKKSFMKKEYWISDIFKKNIQSFRLISVLQRQHFLV